MRRDGAATLNSPAWPSRSLFRYSYLLAAAVGVLGEAATLVVAALLGARSRRERDAAQHFAAGGRPYRAEALRGWGRGGSQLIGDHHQLVRVCTLVAVAADRRGDRPDRCCPVGVDATVD